MRTRRDTKNEVSKWQKINDLTGKQRDSKLTRNTYTPRNLRENSAEFTHLETEFRNAEIQRLTAGDPIRKAQYGFVRSAYMLVRTREQMPKAILAFSQQSDKPDAHLQTLSEAEAVLEAYEADFGITLV